MKKIWGWLLVGVTAGLQTSFVGALQNGEIVLATGKQPDVVVDTRGVIGLTYGAGNEIFFLTSTDGGKTFSAPEKVGSLPKLGLGMGRAPQLAITTDYLVVAAADDSGDLFSWRRARRSGTWSGAKRMNDADTVAKEGFVALATGKGNETVAVWLDLRGNRQNKIFGACSRDGGQTWEANQLIYQSPEKTVCECCKPSVIADARGRVHVQFRNFLQGNRDLHLISSRDGGQTFGPAQKLGTGSWPLKGCPMDGGDLAADKAGQVTTVWRREGNIYLARPGDTEKLLGAGKNPTLVLAGTKPLVAWQQNGNIVYLKAGAEAPLILGKGNFPKLALLKGGKSALCTWERDGQVIIRNITL